jgi:hypothetical protein
LAACVSRPPGRTVIEPKDSWATVFCWRRERGLTVTLPFVVTAAERIIVGAVVAAVLPRVSVLKLIEGEAALTTTV